ncbi:Plant protein of unknown function (DUF863 [Striga hermonthica]|uniref:Uncharacterized protein n=1 Tax=Striga hermonthica TaxID=68872 RepID=A0A9N7NN68_STRHE|nr:Plant protein of unknown function (DUF863 [Striga hermonthica]
MGTKIHWESYLPGFYYMRDLNENFGNSRWHFFYGDKNLPNGQHYNGYPGDAKDDLKQKMLEHEAVFKNQVCELHRLYRIQRDMMEEAKRKEKIDKNRASMEPAASSSNHHNSHLEARKWHMAGFPLLNSRVEIVNSHTSCLRTNGPTSKDPEGLRPSKARKKLFDLRLPADEYIDIQEGENLKEFKESHISGYNSGLADLNKTIQIEDDVGPSSVDFLGCAGNIKANKGRIDQLANKSSMGYLGDTVKMRSGFSTNSSFGSKANTRGSSRGNNYYSPAQDSQPDMFLPSHPLGTNPRDVPRQILESSNRNNHSSSYFTTSWARPVSSWGNQPSSSAQNSAALETCPKPLFFQRNNELTLNKSYKMATSVSKGVQNHPPLTSSDHHGSGILLTGPRPTIDINLIPQNINGENKPEVCQLASLPWLKPKPVTDRKVTLLPAKPEIHTKDEIHESINHSGGKNVFNKEKNGSIDLNVVACEPDEQIAENELITSGKENSIDLNSCLSDSEDYQASVKITLEIDLEVPVFLDSEDDSSLSKENAQNEPIKDEILQNAAEAIFAMSSSCHDKAMRPEVSLSEAINWFVDSISSCSGEKLRRNEIVDEYEAMTLELAETKEEDYMPKPFVLDILKTEEENEANALKTRSRRGLTRRGRQRKDFQRDILPGLTTLSRHEVTEDLQIFGGLMRATGHSWSFGPTRRNGPGRGRRRASAQVACGPTIDNLACAMVEGGLEEKRLTGWGKTTRRPRRQRCPTSNISTVVLT